MWVMTSCKQWGNHSSLASIENQMDEQEMWLDNVIKLRSSQARINPFVEFFTNGVYRIFAHYLVHVYLVNPVRIYVFAMSWESSAHKEKIALVVSYLQNWMTSGRLQIVTSCPDLFHTHIQTTKVFLSAREKRLSADEINSTTPHPTAWLPMCWPFSQARTFPHSRDELFQTRECI